MVKKHKTISKIKFDNPDWWFQNGKPTDSPDFSKRCQGYKLYDTKKKALRALRNMPPESQAVMYYTSLTKRTETEYRMK